MDPKKKNTSGLQRFFFEKFDHKFLPNWVPSRELTYPPKMGEGWMAIIDMIMKCCLLSMDI